MKNYFALFLLFGFWASSILSMQNSDQELWIATSQGNVTEVNRLIHNGIDVNQADANGATPLMLAAQNGEMEIAKLLLAHNANVNAQALGLNYTTPLSMAAQNGHEQMVKLLLDHGAIIDMHPIEGIPLALAAQNGYINIVQILLDHGANINAQSSHFNNITALHQAALKNHADIARLLVRSGADITLETITGLTPLLMAAENNQQSMVELLLPLYAPDTDAAHIREFVANLVRSKKYPIQILLPILIGAKKLDPDWHPNHGSETQNLIIERKNTFRFIQEHFPRNARQAAREAYQALETTHLDTLIGSSNRMKYREKTGGWVECANYKNIYLDKKIALKLQWKKTIHSDKKTSYEPEPIVGDYLIQLNPADKRLFPKPVIIPQWYPGAVVAYYDRTGNCGNRSLLTLYYLIKNSFVERYAEKQIISAIRDAIQHVEFVEFTDMDHTFLIVNRAYESNIKNPQSWGEDAFIVDPWLWDYPGLRLCPAQNALSCLLQVRSIVQEEALAKQVPVMTSDLLSWWLHREKNTPLPIPLAQSIEADNIPLKIVYDEYVKDYVSEDENGDFICTLPDLSRFSLKSETLPAKLPEDVIKELQESKKSSTK